MKTWASSPAETGQIGRAAPWQGHAAGHFGRILFYAAWSVATGLAAKNLEIQIWQPDCSQADAEAVMKAVSGAAKIMASCGIRLEGGAVQSLGAAEAWCEIPEDAEERRPYLRGLFRPLRLKNPRGLSLIVIPTAPQARYAFSIIDESPGAGCGSPLKADLLAESGAIFMTDFGLSQDPEFSALLLAHEIAHELSMRPHPTKAPRGSLLADHAADFGPRISPADCGCLRRSPFLRS